MLHDQNIALIQIDTIFRKDCLPPKNGVAKRIMIAVIGSETRLRIVTIVVQILFLKIVTKLLQIYTAKH